MKNEKETHQTSQRLARAACSTGPANETGSKRYGDTQGTGIGKDANAPRLAQVHT